MGAPKRGPSQGLGEVFFALCKGVDTPRSLGAWLRFKNGLFGDLVDLSWAPSDYTCADAFAVDYLIKSFVEKSKELKTGIDTKAVALEKFAASEVKCAEVNRRIRNSVPNGTLGGILYVAQRKIADILGPIDYASIARLCKWGPGATLDLPRLGATTPNKNSKIPSVTRECWPVARKLLDGDIHWFDAVTGILPGGDFCVTDLFPKFVPGNRIVTVPKNAKTDRTIAAEPTLNSYVQQGIGRFLRGRLKRFGIDLNDQGRNQKLAEEAFFSALATLDLKAASDTIARELVFLLLPIDWAILLDNCRSKCYKLGGKWYLYSKFSSMGNAFTFELESLIFWGLLYAVAAVRGVDPSKCSVYGDDIICPKEIASELIEVLDWCGFTVNTEKSYLSGNFFESCGKHYFGGFDVTPVYQKEILSGAETIRCYNRLLRWSHRSTLGYGLDSRIRPASRAIERMAGPLSRFRIPFGTEGDDGMLTISDEWPAHVYVAGLGWHCRTLIEKQSQKDCHQRGAYAHTLRAKALADTGKGWDPNWYLHCPRGQYKHGLLIRGTGRLKPTRRWIIPTRDFLLSWV